MLDLKAIQESFKIGEVSDGYHTFNELYQFRMMYNALAVNTLHRLRPDIVIEKSKRHSDGQLCFNGGWFIVIINFPGIGQISNHYELEHWDLFNIPKVEVPTIEFDGHTSIDIIDRIGKYIAKN